MSLERLQKIIDRITARIERSRAARRRAGVSKKAGRGKRVTVYVNGDAVRVPEHVDCHFAARGALGLPRKTTVVLEKTPKAALSFRDGYTFTEGQRFVYFWDEFTPYVPDEDDGEDEETAEPWVGDPDAWRKGRPPVA